MYDRPLRRRHQSDDSERLGLAMAMVLLGGLLTAVFVGVRLAERPGDAARFDPFAFISAPRQAERVQSGFRAGVTPAVAEEAPAEATQAVTTAPTVAPTAVPPQVETGRATVAHTDGQGVVLRASPQAKDLTPRGFMDGAKVTIVRREGSDWVLVRGDNGLEGWIPARYLASP
jgi:hypothetical protein